MWFSPSSTIVGQSGRVEVPKQKLPSQVKINNFDYNVTFSKYPAASAHGETCVETKNIVIFEQTNAQTQQDTFLHECLHGLCEDLFDSILASDATKDERERAEENFIRLFTPRLLRFLQENKKWTTYLCTSPRRS